MLTSTPFPDVARTGTTVIGSRYVGGPDRQQLVTDAEADALDCTRPPRGLTAVSWFASADGETVLTLAQWDDLLSHDTYLRGGGYTAPVVGPPPYRLHRSLTEGQHTGVPGCLVTAAFDTDGPERQRHLADSLIAVQPQDGGPPGAISAYFLLSADGTRVLLYTEWTSAEAHQRAGEAGDHDATHAIMSGTPGVRFIGGGRYRLSRSLSLPSS
ncbi:hypothetical protein [Streptomyces sp. NPDC048392]|uniref:hypothetical protein n=1 Tax=Streptomyces sp. NPDC048392 TaxID=3365543 RepID=UPI003723A423